MPEILEMYFRYRQFESVESVTHPLDQEQELCPNLRRPSQVGSWESQQVDLNFFQWEA